jgi:hypothetical protein
MIPWTLERAGSSGAIYESNIEALCVPFLHNPQEPLSYFGGGY